MNLSQELLAPAPARLPDSWGVRRDVLRILIAHFVSRMGLRLTEVALPLIVLQQTGSVWAIGLVAGSSGIALLTSPWWAARLRHRLTSGPALAARRRWTISPSCTCSSAA